MQPFIGNAAALAVALLFYSWRSWHQARLIKEKTLRQRVAYMLWTMATRVETTSRETAALSV